MRTSMAIVVLALLVVAVGCSGADSAAQPPAAPVEDPVIDSFDDGFADTAAQEDSDDLESLDSDLAAFE